MLPNPCVHRDPGGHPRIDASRRSELRDRHRQIRLRLRVVTDAWPLLTEEQYAFAWEIGGFERYRARSVVDGDHCETVLARPGHQLRH